jgi:twitching motility protein PilT
MATVQPPPKDAIKAFRTAAWTNNDEVWAFAQSLGTPAPGDLLKLLAVLLEKGATANPAAHTMRTSVFAALAERVLDPQLFVPYVRALKVADPSVRALLAALLPRVNSVPGHRELCELLSSTDADLRAAACEVLRQIGGKQAFDALVTLVGDANFAGRIDALEVMVPKGLQQSIPLIHAVLRSGRVQERSHALKLLADPRYFGKDPEAAIGAVAGALADPDDRIVAQAVQVVAQLGTEDAFFAHAEPLLFSSNLGHAKCVIDALGRFDSPRAYAMLERKFREGPQALRLAVLDTLEAIGKDGALPLLVEALSHPQVVLRSKAADVMARLSDAGKVDPARTILWLLKSPEVNVRRIAIEIANRVGDKRGDLAPRLLRYLRDEDWWIRERTMDALAEMTGTNLTRHLIDYLRDPSDVVRRYAIGALRRIRDARAMGALLELAAADADWWVREEAVNAVAALGDARAVPRLLDMLNGAPDMKVVLVNALGTLGAAEALPALSEALFDADADVRLAVVHALEKLDARTQIRDIERCLADKVPRVRRAAQELFGRWEVRTEGPTVSDDIALDLLLKHVLEKDADDLLLGAGRHPVIKRAGRVHPLDDVAGAVDETHLRAMLFPLLSHTQRAEVEAGRDVDLSYEVKTLGARFRVNVFQQQTGLGAVFRIIKNDALLMVIENLGLPPVVASFGELKNGLVLVGGPTGSGKSTTLAAILDLINRTSGRHIVTIEDPIEVIHARDRCLITQREVGSHTPSFSRALRAALREDPDVIMVGELRDLETIQFAVSAAETGHLVFGTVHTASSDTTVDRLINAFPAVQQSQVRSMLAETLRAVLCQNLLRRSNGVGRVLAVEILVANDAIANLIRKGKSFQIPSVILTSRAQGMQLMDHELARLVREGHVTSDEAYMRAVDKKVFEGLVSGTGAPPSSRPEAPVATPRGASSAPPPATPSAPPAPAARSSLPQAARVVLNPTRGGN